MRKTTSKGLSPLAKLKLACVSPEAGEHVLGDMLLEHIEELSVVLGGKESQLRELTSLSDEVLAPKLIKHFSFQKDKAAEAKGRALAAAAERAATVLVLTAGWRGHSVDLDVKTLLGDLLADTSKERILFEAFGADILISHALLVKTARVIGKRTDVSAYLDEKGLHFRWNNGRGGLNYGRNYSLAYCPETTTIIKLVRHGVITEGERESLQAMKLARRALGSTGGGLCFSCGSRGGNLDG